MKRKKKELAFYVLTILCCIFAITIIVGVILVVFNKIQNNSKEQEDAAAMATLSEEIMYSETELNEMIANAVEEAKTSTRDQVADEIRNQIETSLVDGNSVIATLRPLYPDDIVVISNSVFHFVPIRDDLKKHNLVPENVQILENGEMQYLQDGAVVSHKGIDVSRYQGEIDWNKVAATGVEYAIIRVGVRGYGVEGKIVLDEMFEKNVKGATAAGLKVGVYFFSQAITEEEALEEANTVLTAIAPYSITYPIVYDVEKTGAKEGRMNQLTVEDRTKVTRVFIDKIKEAGYTPMIYSNIEMWTVLLDMASFEDVEKWFAYYSTDLYFPYEYSIWQYSDKGQVDGIKGDVDMNISFKEW